MVVLCFVVLDDQNDQTTNLLNDQTTNLPNDKTTNLLNDRLQTAASPKSVQMYDFLLTKYMQLSVFLKGKRCFLLSTPSFHTDLERLQLRISESRKFRSSMFKSFRHSEIRRFKDSEIWSFSTSFSNEHLLAINDIDALLRSAEALTAYIIYNIVTLVLISKHSVDSHRINSIVA